MYISSLTIRNFKNFRNAKLIFRKGVNTIIGENGSGKTNLFYALRLLIDNSLPRYIRFSEGDFNRSLDFWAGHWIIISLNFEELDTTDEAQAFAMQAVGNMGLGTTGNYTLYFRPKYIHRKSFHELSQDISTKGDLQAALDNLTLDDYESVYLSRCTVDFSDDEVYKKYVGDFEALVFPNPDDKADDIYGGYLPKEISIYNEVSCTFIKALRDVESDLRSYTNNPLINLFRGKDKTVEIGKKSDIIDSINTLNSQITNLDEVSDIKRGIDQSLRNAFGTTYAPNVDIRSELPNEIERLFQSLKLWVGDPDEDDYKGRIWELSLGGANLIYLSLKLLEYQKVQTDKIANFLLIEEPEAHIHTHIQRTLFSKLSDKKTQVIVSTHSTHISSVSKIGSINVLSRSNKKADVYHPSKNLSRKELKSAERFLDAVRSNLLFAKGVILVEGDTEQILIPALFKEIFGLSLDEIGVSLINVGSTGFKNLGNLFHADRIQKNCAILTDLDESLVILPSDPNTDTPVEKHYRAAQKSGADRKASLTKFIHGNPFLKPFYSKYTFEVDFFLESNSHEFITSLLRVYKNQANIDTSKLKLESPDFRIAGAEALRLAEKFGKGWFALQLSESLSYNTNIPLYIMKAVKFASAHINMASKSKAVSYRIRKIKSNSSDVHYLDAERFDFSNKSDEEIVREFYSTFDKDQLTVFLLLP